MLETIAKRSSVRSFTDQPLLPEILETVRRAGANALRLTDAVMDSLAESLARLRQERRGPWLTAGFDVDAKTLEAVRAGVNFVTIDPEHYLKGYLSAAILVDSVRDHGGKLPKGWFVSPGGVIDTGNVSDIITRQSSPQAAYAWYRATIERLLADVPGQLKPLDQAR